MIVGVPTETFPGERRVALVPSVVAGLIKAKLEVLIQTGAGDAAGFPDADYTDKGAKIAATRDEIFQKSDIVLQVRGYGANPDMGAHDLGKLRRGQTVIGYLEPLAEAPLSEKLAGTGATSFSMELMPRITRAQSMDSLSSMATVAGYKAVLIAADHLPRMCPMMMTAAGTITPAKFFIIGAGVAGLQAIATAKRLGAIVNAYDVRPAVKEQVESLGGRFVELELDAGDAEDKGGYAKAMGEEFYKKQRQMMLRVVPEVDCVITTAAIPGKKAPILVTEEMVRTMQPGSVIVDLAAERGGNCELTKPGETVEVAGVTIVGPANLPSDVPYHASQMYAKNITTFLKHLVNDEGQLTFDMDDEITKETLVTKGGAVVHGRVKAILGQSSGHSPSDSPAKQSETSGKGGAA